MSRAASTSGRQRAHRLAHPRPFHEQLETDHHGNGHHEDDDPRLGEEAADTSGNAR